MSNTENKDVDMTKIQNYFAKVAKKLENMPNVNQIPLKDYFDVKHETRLDIQNCLDYIQSALKLAKSLANMENNPYNLPSKIVLADPYDSFRTKEYPCPSMRVIDYIHENMKINAIKEYRQQTNLGLADAKNLVEHVMDLINNSKK